MSAYSVRDWTECSTLGLAFLKRHENYTLFLMSNLQEHGHALGMHPNSGNFKCVFSNEGQIQAVFCLAQRGTLLLQANSCDIEIFQLILEACQHEQIDIGAVIGAWEVAYPFWQYLKEMGVVRKDGHISKEILYSINLRKLSYSTNDTSDAQVRLLHVEDFASWKALNLAYLQEQSIPNQLSEAKYREDFVCKVHSKILWGAFVKGQLVSVGGLNAKAFDLGQVGGIYTAPNWRQQGLGKRLMHHVLSDAHNIHQLRKLVIFTGENNRPARSLYESLGVKPEGYLALLFAK